MSLPIVRVALWALVIAGCATVKDSTFPVYWENLPFPKSQVPVFYLTSDKVAQHGRFAENVATLVKKLVEVHPLPVDAIVILSVESSPPQAHLLAPILVATGYRCGSGTEPGHYGCMHINYGAMQKLSEQAQIGTIAHELGHVEKGHRFVVGETIWQFNATENEADDAGVALLNDAGYCGGLVMRRTLREWKVVVPDVLQYYFPDSILNYDERIERLPTACHK